MIYASQVRILSNLGGIYLKLSVKSYQQNMLDRTENGLADIDWFTDILIR